MWNTQAIFGRIVLGFMFLDAGNKWEVNTFQVLLSIITITQTIMIIIVIITDFFFSMYLMTQRQKEKNSNYAKKHYLDLSIL